MQVAGHLIENDGIVPNVDLYGAWDEELVVKKQDGQKETIWQYKAPQYVDSR